MWVPVISAADELLNLHDKQQSTLAAKRKNSNNTSSNNTSSSNNREEGEGNDVNQREAINSFEGDEKHKEARILK